MMQILEVVLFSHNGDKRTVTFKENTVNIIHSDPNTGKSSLIDVIDYCLGQQKNHINSTKIHNVVSWLGVTIKINGRKLFLARKNVEYNTTTDLMYIEYLTDSSPEKPPESTNINRAQVIDFLSTELGIERIPLIYKDNEEFFVNIRHSSFFCYLTQNEIDTTDFLYHRSHDGFLNLQIYSALEYFLGTLNEDLFYDFIQMQKLKRKLATVRSKLKELELIRGNVYEKAYELLGKCQRHEIYHDDKLPSDTDEYITALKSIIINWKPTEIPSLSQNVSELYDQLFLLRGEINDKEEVLYELKKYSNITQDFKAETDHQKNRLKLIEIFDDEKGNYTCPLCENKLEKIPPSIESIKKDFLQIEKDLGGTQKIRHYVDDIVKKLEKEKTDLKNDVSKLSSKIQGFLNEQTESKEIFKENLQISELIGEIKLWLESVKESDEKSALGKEKIQLTESIDYLEDKIRFNKQSPRRINILNSFNDILKKWAIAVEIYQAKNYQFQYNVETITLLSSDNKPINYSNLGGGHNMLGIHLILYLALHRYFIDAKRPIPNFLIFDQPSTPYFSKDPVKGKIDDYYKGPRETLAKIYKFIIDKTEEMKNLQVIITDQAYLHHEDWFEKYLVTDWGEALVPNDWK